MRRLFVRFSLIVTVAAAGSLATFSEARADGGGMKLGRYSVVDRQHGNMVVGTLALPQGWAGTSSVTWDMTDAYAPGRIQARLAPTDGSAWFEMYPQETFTWLDRDLRRTQVGSRNFGMIYYPHINIQQALVKFVVGRYRGRVQSLKIVGFRPIPSLAKTLANSPVPGESLAARVHYVQAGHQVDEEFFCWLSTDQPVSGEHHRVFAFLHSMGAMDGKLDSLHPVLGTIARSFHANPAWAQLHTRTTQQIRARFNQQVAQGYANIRAAGAMSRQISAQSDATIARVEAQQRASNQNIQQQRQQRAQANTTFDKTNDDNDQYLRGTERMEDPYWGTSERSYNYQYHWTDGAGNYHDTNDPTDDPNQHSNVQWQQMQPAK